MDRDVEIVFTDGEKRTISKVSTMEVNNGVLILKHKWTGGIGFYSTDEDLGRFPIVNIKSYRWMGEAY